VRHHGNPSQNATCHKVIRLRDSCNHVQHMALYIRHTPFGWGLYCTVCDIKLRVRLKSQKRLLFPSTSKMGGPVNCSYANHFSPPFPRTREKLFPFLFPFTLSTSIYARNAMWLNCTPATAYEDRVENEQGEGFQPVEIGSSPRNRHRPEVFEEILDPEDFLYSSLHGHQNALVLGARPTKPDVFL